nr:hypothetical protein [Egibacter rhizosphaerae]
MKHRHDRDRRIDRHPLAVAVTTDERAGQLVADHQRFIEARVADATFGEPVEVGPADPHGIDPDQLVARPCHRHRAIGETDVTGAVQSCDPHAVPCPFWETTYRGPDPKADAIAAASGTQGGSHPST